MSPKLIKKHSRAAQYWMGKPMFLLLSCHRKEETSTSQMEKASSSRNQFHPFPIPWLLLPRRGGVAHLIGDNEKRKWTRGFHSPAAMTRRPVTAWVYLWLPTWVSLVEGVLGSCYFNLHYLALPLLVSTLAWE